ncbi:hypothetical protein VHN57_08645 [Sphingobium sp. WW5]|uniref:hypothetical protein n=1 Tax=unclassified Sphingobium TaxID=2611147 RepID=UPI003C1B6A4D
MPFEDDVLNAPASNASLSQIAITFAIAVNALADAVEAVERGDLTLAKENLGSARKVAEKMTTLFDNLTGYTDDYD